MPLSDAQKAIKAQTKIEQLALEESMGNLKTKINELFADAPIAVSETTSKAEVEELISAVKAGTATNEKISRFLDIASNFGL